MQPILLTATAEKVTIEDPARDANVVMDDRLPPPTFAQIAYWRELCGALSQVKGTGMADDAWPVDLAPSKPTLKAMVHRGLIVRRKQAWHLKRGWYGRVAVLRVLAVPTPRQSLGKRPRPDLPSYVELEGFEQICRWLDAQPKRRARLPFVGLREQLGSESEVPIALLHQMRKYRLARHTSTCEWALSPTWKDRLLNLWKGVDREVRELFPVQPTPSEPFVVAAGIDTWYLNRIDPGGLPSALRRKLDELQKQAAEDEEEVDTRWMYDGVPLRMYRAGVNTDQGGGVSWSHILRNNSLALLVRKAPLGGIIAQARLGSECLWRLTPRRALDEVDALMRRMWASPIPFRRERKHEAARWQVSQVHLAVDVANAPLDAEQATRYVSRSRTQAVYEAAKSEVEKLMRAIHGPESEDMDAVVMDWDALYEDDGYDAFDPFDPFDDLVPERDRDVEPVPVEHRAMTTFRSGGRISGMTFSPGGDVSMVLYDKPLQARLSGKRHMEPIWAASGWMKGVPVTRHEARLRRPAVRELGLPHDVRPCLDDPWEFLAHQKDVFAAVVGRAEGCPDAVDVAWIRRVVPEESDSRRSRWPTDPAWQVLQSATFVEAPTEARKLIRRRQRGHDTKKLDQGQYGYLASRTAILHPDGGQWTLSRAFGEALPQLEAVEREQGKDFGELVRERRRQRGLPLPIAEKVLPFRVTGHEKEVATHSADIGPSAHAGQAQTRVAEAWAQLAAAEQAGRSRRILLTSTSFAKPSSHSGPNRPG